LSAFTVAYTAPHAHLSVNAPVQSGAIEQDCHMLRLNCLLLSSALLVAPVSMTAALAQSDAGSQAPGTSTHSTTNSGAGPVMGRMSSSDVVPPTKNGPANTGMVRGISPDSPGAQLQNPTGAQPGTGSGMGKVSGTAAGN
jgi:hypothetical protein